MLIYWFSWQVQLIPGLRWDTKEPGEEQGIRESPYIPAATPSSKGSTQRFHGRPVLAFERYGLTS